MKQQFHNYLFGNLSESERTAFEAILAKDKVVQEDFEAYQSNLLKEYVLNRVSDGDKTKIERLVVTDSAFAEEVQFQQKLHTNLNIYAQQAAVKKTILGIRQKLAKEETVDAEDSSTQNADILADKVSKKESTAPKKNPQNSSNKSWLLLLLPLLLLPLLFFLWKGLNTNNPSPDVTKELQEIKQPSTPSKVKITPTDNIPYANTKEKEEKLGKPKNIQREQESPKIVESTQQQEVENKPTTIEPTTIQPKNEEIVSVPLSKEQTPPISKNRTTEPAYTAIDVDQHVEPIFSTTRSSTIIKEETILEQAKLAVQQENWSKSYDLYQKYLTTNSIEEATPKTLLEAAYIALKNKEWDTSIKLSKQIFEKGTFFNQKAEWYLAIALYNTGKRDQAKEIFQKISTSGSSFEQEAKNVLTKYFK